MRPVVEAPPGGGIRRRGEQGAALVELAIVLPLLIVILLGTIDFGRAFQTAMVVTNAVRAGAQWGAQSTSNAGSAAGMATAADAVLAANGLGSGLPIAASRLCQCATNAGVFSPTSPVNTCTAVCTGGHVVTSVTVTAIRTFSMLSPFPGLPSSVTITRSASARAQ